MTDVLDWFKQLPVFTRYWFGLSIAFSLYGKLGFSSPYWFILTPNYLYKFELWRPITSLFYYPITNGTGIHFLTNLYLLYHYSLQLETGHFFNKPADYLFLLIINWISTLLLSMWMQAYLLMDPMVLSVVYIWCQFNKETIVRFWFGTQFKAMYLPWVLLGFNILINGGGLNEIIGIIVGHFYYFSMYTYPLEYGTGALFSTPKILESYFPPYQNRQGGFTYIPPTSNINSNSGNSNSFFRGHNWGRGRTLND